MYKINTGNSEFNIDSSSPDLSEGTINQRPYRLDIREEKNGFHILRDHKSYNVDIISIDHETKSFQLAVNGTKYNVEAKDRFDILLKELGMENIAGSVVNDLKAPMPGLVLSIEVKAGDVVKKGDPLIVLEAMKMENVLKSPSDVTIKNIPAEKGKPVEKNQVLIEFE